MSAPAVAARDVRVRFGGLEALRGVSLQVAPGELVGLIGPNGAGKTTLLNVLSGHRRGDEGAVELAGTDVSGLPPHRRARLGLRRMFQYGGLVGDESVITNLRIAHHAAPARTSEAASALVGALAPEVVGARDCRDLPAGTARLVELACVLAGDPSVLLLDEPSSGLSATETELLADSIRRVMQDGARAVLLVAHDMRLVMGLATRVVVLDDGRVVASGTPAEVRADTAVAALYLGTRR
jgi:branched-chain amino acid transport system ATP-binding protein